MATGNSNSSSGGIGFLGLLGIVFITLKLMHYTAPLWSGFVIALAVLAVFGLVVGIAAVARRYRKWVRS